MRACHGFVAHYVLHAHGASLLLWPRLGDWGASVAVALCCPFGPKIGPHCRDSLPHTSVLGSVLGGMAAMLSGLVFLDVGLAWAGGPQGRVEGSQAGGWGRGSNLTLLSSRQEVQSAPHALCPALHPTSERLLWSPEVPRGCDPDMGRSES